MGEKLLPDNQKEAKVGTLLSDIKEESGEEGEEILDKDTNDEVRDSTGANIKVNLA